MTLERNKNGLNDTFHNNNSESLFHQFIVHYLTFIDYNEKYDFCRQLCPSKKVHSTQIPHSHYHFPCSVDCKIGIKTLIWN